MVNNGNGVRGSQALFKPKSEAARHQNNAVNRSGEAARNHNGQSIVAARLRLTFIGSSNLPCQCPMSENADDGPVGGAVGLPNFVSPVTSARCRIFRRHVSPVFVASLLRNVFVQVDTNPLARHSAGVADRFGNRRIATAFE